MGFFDKNASNNLKVTDFLLRLFVIPFSIAALWLTVTNHQDDSNYGSLDFSNIMGLKYMVCINAIAAGYACLAAVSLWIKCLVSKAWVFFVSDQIMAYLMVTSMGTVIEILYLAYNGNAGVTWSEACSTYGRFCGRLKLALTLHVVALFCFFLLASISAYRLFSRFDPPFISSNKDTEGEEK